MGYPTTAYTISGRPSLTTHESAGGISPTYGYFKFTPDKVTATPLQSRRDLITWKEAIEPQLEVAGLKGFADGTVLILHEDEVELHGEFCAAHLLTFMVISRCCLPMVQIALKPCRLRLDAGHQAWRFIMSTYQATDDLYIGQLEELRTHLRMVGVEYATASYITHVIKGLPSSFNLMKRLSLLPQAHYVAPMKQSRHQRQRGKPSGSGSGGGRSTKDVDEKKSTRDKGRGGSGRQRECWICGSPDHLSYECPDRENNDEDKKGGRGRSASRRPRRDERSWKDKQTSKKTSSTNDVDPSSGKGRGDGEASCLMVGVVEPTVSLAPEAGEDFKVVAAAVQANPMAVLLESACSHHLMGTKKVFVDMALSGDMKHVRGFNGVL
ncbi:unnamed protein product [Closterium sp. NIES-53]